MHIVCKYERLVPNNIPFNVMIKLPTKLIIKKVTNTEDCALLFKEIRLNFYYYLTCKFLM